MFDSISDIPVINEERSSRPAGFMEDDSDGIPEALPDDIAAVMKELDDDTPLEGQRMLMQGGGWLAPNRNKLGTPEQAVSGKKVRLIRFDEKGGETNLAEYTFDGMNDPDIKRIFKKYAIANPEDGLTYEQQTRSMTLAMREIEEFKKTKANAKRPAAAVKPAAGSAEQPGRTSVPTPQPQRIDAVFHFGGVDGSRRARYDDATVDGELLTLVAGESLVNSGVYEPPDLGPNRKFTLELSNMPAPLEVFYGGLRHSYDGRMFYLLFIDNAAEE